MKRSLIALTVLALAGCTTSLERRQASGGFEYINAKQSQPLTIPAELDQPNYSSEFAIPKVGDQADMDALGQRVDVRPPLQVLPLAAGTRVQEDGEAITVVIETTDDERNLASDINQALIGYLGEREIAIASNQNGLITTDWIENEEEISTSWWRPDEIYLVRQRYQFDTQIKDHGRSGSVSISVLEHQEGLNDIDDSIVLTDSDKRRYAIDMLNGAISYFNYERKKQNALREIKEGRGFKSELGEDADGNSAFIAKAPFEQVWRRMQHLLPAMGFQIRDLDRQLGMLFVEYEHSSGFWQNLWGNEDALPLEDGAYRVKLVEQEDTTTVTFFDADAEPLSSEQVAQMAVTFRELVQKELKELK